jgi:hypothetical protein
VTAKKAIPLARAGQYADQFVALIGSACERCTTVGALRRMQPSITELAFLAIPIRMDETDLFGELRGTRDMLSEAIGRLVKQERLLPESDSDAPTRRFRFRTARGMLFPLSLTWTWPRRWGADLALLTGPDGLSLAMQARQGTVTHRGRAGLLPPDYRYYDGLKTWEGGQDVDTPEEDDFLRLIYGDDIPRPERRR